ncbi:MAG: mechanosensitive ion channel, partial [Lachnospiraceae bacterium]|nr:mechanosensitive ion channel [Lachnospiraceae bacterium]
MKEKKNIKRLIVLAISAGIFGISLIIGFASETFENNGGFGRSLRLSWPTFLNVLVAVSFLVAINCLIQFLLGFLKKGSNRSKTMSTVISSLVKYAVVIVGFCWVLRIMGVNISTIVASLGIAALVLGFGAESLIADVVTGFFFLFENQFNVGDIIEVDGFRGTVESIEIRTISIKDAGGNVKIINNSKLINVINR